MNIKKKFTSISILLGLTTSTALFSNNQLEFSSDVPPSCGVAINAEEGKGAINFGGSTDAAKAQFMVSSNSPGGAAKVTFDDITPSLNIQGHSGYFKINNSNSKTWDNAFDVDVTSGEMQVVSANVPTHATQITAGAASVTTTLTITCNY